MLIGRRIFEEELQGKERADYGSYLIKNLSIALTPDYGSGFSARQLERCRQFYCAYPIAHTLYVQLNWSQYKLLIAIPNKDKREYNELEAVNEGWTKRQLERQINSKLYERLLLCTDKDDTAVRLALPEGNKTILASRRQLYLPTKEQLVREINAVRALAKGRRDGAR